MVALGDDGEPTSVRPLKVPDGRGGTRRNREAQLRRANRLAEARADHAGARAGGDRPVSGPIGADAVVVPTPSRSAACDSHGSACAPAADCAPGPGSTWPAGVTISVARGARVLLAEDCVLGERSRI